MKEEIKLSSKIENNGNEISLITIATYNDKEYDLQDLLNNLLNELQRKDDAINELKYDIQKIRDLFYEKCRIRNKNGYYSMNNTDLQDFYDILDKIKELESKGEEN